MKEKEIYVPVEHKYALTVQEAAEYFGIGQGKLRELIRIRRCPFTIYVGRKCLIKRKELEKYLDSQIEI